MSHGICNRHKEDMYKQMGKTAPASPDNKTIDLKTLSPEEIKIAGNVFAILREKDKAKKEKEWAAQKAAQS